MVVPNFSLKGKVAVVTGGRRGIGRAISLTFAEAGADVAVCDKVVEDGELQAAANEIQRVGRRSLAVQVDITREGDVENMVQQAMDKFGKIDILINNAGVLIRKPLLEQSTDDWNTIIDTDLKGYFLCSKAVGKKMMERKQGNIISIASMAGVRAGKKVGAYYVAKAGVIMLTKVLALEMVDFNIRVNAIAPGHTVTELERHIWSNPEVLKEFEAAIPLGRMAEPHEIAATALFLASDASNYILGETIFVDGGRSI